MPDYIPTGISGTDKIPGAKGLPRGHSYVDCLKPRGISYYHSQKISALSHSIA